MSALKQLFDLQEIDLRLIALEQSLSGVKAKLAGAPAIATVKAKLAKVNMALDERLAKRRTLEREGQDAKTKLAAVESKLFSGSVTKQKEAEALQQEHEFLKGQQSANEDALLNTMVAVDEAQALKEKFTAELQKLEAERAAETKELQAEKVRLEQELAEAAAERAEAAKAVPQMDMARYESIRKSRGGQGIAKVVGGTCQACRVKLPSGELQKAKAGAALVQCNSCRRILYVP
ncbi:MAG: hypothetical protein FJ317_07560 [SAR202 cluster bacterium]|nr:hypothetical protein [SAR202 cluster bacterium]